MFAAVSDMLAIDSHGSKNGVLTNGLVAQVMRVVAHADKPHQPKDRGKHPYQSESDEESDYAGKPLLNRLHKNHRTEKTNQLQVRIIFCFQSVSSHTSNQRHVRAVAMKWIGRDDLRSRFHLPGSSQVQKYHATGDPKDGPSFDPTQPDKYPLRVDVRGPQKSAWNQRCATLFAKQYVQQPTAHTRNIKLATERFITHIKALARQYKNLPSTKLSDRAKMQHLQSKQKGLKRTRRSTVRSIGFNFPHCDSDFA